MCIEIIENVVAWYCGDDVCTVFVCLIKYYLNMLNVTKIECNH